MLKVKWFISGTTDVPNSRTACGLPSLNIHSLLNTASYAELCSHSSDETGVFVILNGPEKMCDISVPLSSPHACTIVVETAIHLDCRGLIRMPYGS